MPEEHLGGYLRLIAEAHGIDIGTDQSIEFSPPSPDFTLSPTAMKELARRHVAPRP